MLSVYSENHKEALFPRKAYRAELQKTVENEGLALQVSDLLNEAEIIHALYYRYRNAHHCAQWFSPFSMLHRRVSQVANWVVELHQAPKKRVPRLVTAIKIGIQKIQTTYLQPAFWSFYTVLALGQYVTVGFALLGCVSRVAFVLSQVHPIPRTVGKVLDEAVQKGATVMADDIGEVLVRVADKSKQGKHEKTEKSEKKVKTEKKTLDKMDIDDIFGTKKKKTKEKKLKTFVKEVVKDDTSDTESAKLKKTKVDNFFADMPKKKPASEDTLEQPKKKKKKLDSSDPTKKKKKSKKNAIDDIFG